MVVLRILLFPFLFEQTMNLASPFVGCGTGGTVVAGSDGVLPFVKVGSDTCYDAQPY
jgi:hypothetical protein